MFSLTIISLLAICAFGFAKTGQEAHLTPEQSAKVFQHSMTCISETNVNPEILVQIRSGKFSEDEKFKKFMYCLLRKTSLAMKDGHIKVEKTVQQYPKDVDREGVKKALEECNKETGKTPTDTAYNIFKCFHAKTPVHLVL